MLDVAVRRQWPGFLLDAAFEAPPGITVLYGRSGAGKTMLVNMLAGLARPEHGHIRMDGETLFEAGIVDLPPEQRRFGFVFQESRLFPHLSVNSNLRYGERMKPVSERRFDFGQIVDLLGLEGLLSRRPATLSGGEKQRVAIGRALLSGPRALLMDEPLANLDAERKADLLPFIESLRDELGMTIVYVSHAMEEIIRLADTLVLLDNGKAVAAGRLEDLTSRLDLRPLTGRAEAGSVLTATVLGHDEKYQLTTLGIAGGNLFVGLLDLAIGARLRVRIRARDVALSLTPPEATSVLNKFSGVITEIADDDGPQVDILLDIGCPLRARITRRSVAELDLQPGQSVHALVKAVAIDRRSLGPR